MSESPPDADTGTLPGTMDGRSGAELGQATDVGATSPRQPSGSGMIVTRLEGSGILMRDARDRLRGADLTLANLGAVVALLEAREALWRAADAALGAEHTAWDGIQMTSLWFHLPRGWTPAGEALGRLTPAESGAWLIPRAQLPALRRAAAAAGAATAILARHRRGERLGAADIDRAVSLLDEVVLLKWRLGVLDQCAAEFLALAELLLAVRPEEALAHARRAIACAERGDETASLAVARQIARAACRLVAGGQTGLRAADGPGGPAGRGCAPDGSACPGDGTAVPPCRDVPKDLEALFLVSTGLRSGMPIGPFEPLGGGEARTGLQQLMAGDAVPSPVATLLEWRRKDGLWVALTREDGVSRRLWDARESVRLARGTPRHETHVRAAFKHAVVALESFVNLTVHFIVVDGRQAWKDAPLDHVFDPKARRIRKMKMVDRLQYLAKGLFDEPWLPPSLEEELREVLAARNRMVHPPVGDAEPLRVGGRVLAVQEAGPAGPGIAPIEIYDAIGVPGHERAAHAVAVIERTIEAFRAAYGRARARSHEHPA